MLQIFTCDISTKKGAYRVVRESQEQLDGPIGGVFHLATVLRDTVFETQEAKNFREVCIYPFTLCSVSIYR